MSEAIVKAKATWRQLARANLAGLSAEEKATRSRQICAAVKSDPAWARAKVVALFAALPQEVDLSPLWEERGARRFCFPRVEGDEMHFYVVETQDELKPTRWRVPEPHEHAPQISPAEIDVILLPGLAFGRDGSRLGRGGGYYDRILAHCSKSTERIGICYRPQLFDALPSESHDQRVDRVLCDAE